MIGQILGAVGGLATTYLDGKVAVQKANAEIKVKQATGEIDWDLAAIQATQNSWKDEWITLLFSIPLILAFCGDCPNLCQSFLPAFDSLYTVHRVPPGNDRPQNHSHQQQGDEHLWTNP